MENMGVENNFEEPVQKIREMPKIINVQKNLEIDINTILNRQKNKKKEIEVTARVEEGQSNSKIDKSLASNSNKNSLAREEKAQSNSKMNKSPVSNSNKNFSAVFSRKLLNEERGKLFNLI